MNYWYSQFHILPPGQSFEPVTQNGRCENLTFSDPLLVSLSVC